ncbi:MAG: Chloride channel core [Verrucomicrobiales bacterium]|nr:Chloride channel core [Verrucomicrobiales bacterium]
MGFREATEWLHHVFAGPAISGHVEGYVDTFRAMPLWQRVAVPALGGLLAGLTLTLGSRFKAKENSTDYMEAVVVGDGNLAVKVSLVKSVSAWFSSASGASIGREGPLVTLASLGASVAGRILGFTLARKRQMVACGAAAGIASAYNAPIAGAFFVAEIVLGSLAMEAFGPLVVSSVTATLATRAHYGSAAIYEAPVFTLHSNLELIPYLALGLACGLTAPAYLKLLRSGEKVFTLVPLPVWLRLMLGGLAVGLLALFHPEVAGNGRVLVFTLLHDPGPWEAVTVILICKLLATTATFGSGAVGGVFTPTLFTGAAFGYLFGTAAAALVPAWGLEPRAFGLVGMGAFLAAATGAPVMAIIMLFELTLNYQILMPVMLAGVVGYYTCRSLDPRSLYSDALNRKGAAAVAWHLSTLKVGDLMSPDTAVLPPGTVFGDVARAFLQSRHTFLNVVSEGRFRGVVSLHDIKPYLDQPDLESLLIARDVMREDFPSLRADQTMYEALDVFGRTEADCLSVTGPGDVFLGSVTRTDVLLFLAGKPKKETAQSRMTKSAV